MSEHLTFPLNDPQATLEMVGGKGASLSQLVRAGFEVPAGFHITTLAYRRFVEENLLFPRIKEILERTNLAETDSLTEASREITEIFLNGTIPQEVARAVVAAYADLPGYNPPVAVRSSATAEDLPEASFAGQQDTYLNLSGDQAVLEATRRCWASLWTARAIAYRTRQNIPADGVALAVVIQLLVPAEAAGIMFTANPVNGKRDQIVLTASWGLGEAVVSGLVTPDTLAIDKASGRILERETAKKTVQTVRVNGGTETQPVPESLQDVPVLNDQQTAELGRIGKAIEKLYEMPMDIEWTLLGGKFSVVQARPITALPEPEPAIPLEWKLPQGAYAAMRNNIVELMADPLSPLFKTLGLSAVNRSLDRLLSGFLGNKDVMPGMLIIPVNEYAYYNGSVRFGPIVKIIFDTPGILKRMFSGAVERWTEIGKPRYQQTIEKWRSVNWKVLPASELLAAVNELTEAAVDAYGSLVSGVLPAAWISEALFTFAYKLVKRKDDPSAPTFLMGFDSLPIQAEKSLYDLAQWVRGSQDLSAYLTDTKADQITVHLKADTPPARMDPLIWQEWQIRFQGHLERFGHMIYNLDFANPVPADDPTPVLETLKLFVRGQGVNPYERQSAAVERREQAISSIQGRLKGFRLNLFKKNLERAQRYAPLREDGLADVGMSYPLLRRMFSELGRRFVEAGACENIDHIYWLEENEVKEGAVEVDRGSHLSSMVALINQRRAAWQAANQASPPMVLPQLKIFGFDLMQLKAGRSVKDGKDTLKGVAASPGRVTAQASVLQGPDDFSRMRTGNVLVASITTPAWTPLFARAAAVVTDVGGPLSHGSIVAREYSIPAVLGTDSATKNIKDGQMITVDGDKGLVILGEST